MKTVNLPHSDLSTVDLYLVGREIEKAEHKAAEGGKVGTLRGGSAGCITDQGEIYGTCHRMAFARFKGIEHPVEETSYTWFDAGYANEEAWLTKLKLSVKTLGPDFFLKQEEECPISWDADGVTVTGRPDLMIFRFEHKTITDLDGERKPTIMRTEEPVLGIELKVVCTVNSAIGVYCEDKPKISNLIQAAHYSMEHKCPFNLVYSYRSSGRVPGWAERFKTKLRLKEKTFTNRSTGKEFTKREYYMDPFTKEFKIGFENDTVYYIKDDGTRVDTPITGEGIRKYYRSIANMPTTKDLGVRVSSRDLEGKELPYNPCNYCPLESACDQFEYDMDSWLDKVKLLSEEA